MYMEKSFRDILAQFLEGDDENLTSAPSENATSQESQSSNFEPLWRPDFAQNPLREGMNRYRSTRAPHSTPVTPLPTKAVPLPPPEVMIPLEKLSSADLARVKELIALGGMDLTQGLSLKRLKKAHRHLARKFHPDRLPAGSSTDQVKLTSVNFTILQAAYEHLLQSLAAYDMAKSA